MAKTRYYHGCGKFTMENKLVLIVAGDNYPNYKSVEFLVPSDNEPKWIAGKKSFVHPCIYGQVKHAQGHNWHQNMTFSVSLQLNQKYQIHTSQSPTKWFYEFICHFGKDFSVIL